MPFGNLCTCPRPPPMTEGTFPYWSTSNWPLHPFYNILIEGSWTRALMTFAALVRLQ